MATDTDFNNIREWLIPKLCEQRMSVEQLAQKAGLTRSALYYFLDDKNRPTEESMTRICHAIGASVEDGLAQYSGPRKPGRKGKDGTRTRSDQ